MLDHDVKTDKMKAARQTSEVVKGIVWSIVRCKTAM